MFFIFGYTEPVVEYAQVPWLDGGEVCNCLLIFETESGGNEIFGERASLIALLERTGPCKPNKQWYWCGLFLSAL